MVNILVFVTGSIMGSFLNVCIYRLPRRQSVVAPRSYCPNCKEPIQWYDNIPILSYLILRGRCRRCKGRISLRYLIVEILTASLFLLLYLFFGFSPRFFAYATMAGALIISTFVDLETQEIPDEVTLSGIVIGLIVSLVSPAVVGEAVAWKGCLASALGALAGGTSIYLMGFLGELVFKKEAMGGGDVKLLAMIGAFLGWRLALLVFFIAPLFGSVVGIVMRIREGSETIPYGPYLSLAALVAVFWGEKILGLLFYGMY